MIYDNDFKVNMSTNGMKQLRLFRIENELFKVLY